MSDFTSFAKYFINEHKDTEETIQELRLLLLRCECSVAETNDIIEAIISYRNHT